MNSANNNSTPVSSDVYHKSYSDLSALHRQLPEDTVAALAREVIKRLSVKKDDRRASRESIVALGEALIDEDAGKATALIEQHFRAGADVRTLYIGFLAPAADLLGKWWESDEVTFADVTVGTGRIYGIMRSLNRRDPIKTLPEAKSAFFAAAPADDHVLGLKMATDLARKAGWQIEAALDSDHDELVNQITGSGQLVIGISAGGILTLPSLARLVLALRISAPEARILVSGAILDVAEEQVRLLNVDAIARSFEEAMSELDRLWDSLLPQST